MGEEKSIYRDFPLARAALERELERTASGRGRGVAFMTEEEWTELLEVWLNLQQLRLRRPDELALKVVRDEIRRLWNPDSTDIRLLSVLEVVDRIEANIRERSGPPRGFERLLAL